MWTNCPTEDEERLQCAIFQVPLDWQNPTNGQTLNLPLVRVKAVNATDSTKSIIFNPGGPGGSGIKFFVNGGGSSLQRYVYKTVASPQLANGGLVRMPASSTG